MKKPLIRTLMKILTLAIFKPKPEPKDVPHIGQSWVLRHPEDDPCWPVDIQDVKDGVVYYTFRYSLDPRFGTISRRDIKTFVGMYKRYNPKPEAPAKPRKFEGIIEIQRQSERRHLLWTICWFWSAIAAVGFIAKLIIE